MLRFAVSILLLGCTSCSFFADVALRIGYAPEGRYTTVAGRPLHYRRGGQRHAPTAVVFLHGNPGLLQDFAGVIDELDGDHFEWVSFERPGHGYSPGGRVNPDEQADVAIGLLKQLDMYRPSRAVLVVGHSWGAALAQCVARRHADVVDGLVLINPVAVPDDTLLDGLATAATRDGVHWLWSWLPFWPTVNGAIAGHRLRTAFHPVAVDAGLPTWSPARALAFYAHPDRVLAMVEDDRRMHRVLTRAPLDDWTWERPLVLLAGTDDGVVEPSRHVDALATRFPHAVRARVDGEGHQLPITQAALVARAVRLARDWVHVHRRGGRTTACPAPPDPTGYRLDETVDRPRATDGGFAALARYFRNRLDDTLDLVPLSVSVGGGIHVEARATRLAGTAIGQSDQLRHYGIVPGRPADRVGSWREYTVAGNGVLWVRESSVEPRELANAFGAIPIATGDPLHRGSALDVEVGAHLGWAGARVGVSPIGALDWLLGWFGIDVSGDDQRH